MDIDKMGREVRKNMREAYLFDSPRDSALFRFEPTPISLGVIRGGDCGEILYPNTIRDLIDFSLRECVRREIPAQRAGDTGGAGAILLHTAGTDPAAGRMGENFPWGVLFIDRWVIG